MAGPLDPTAPGEAARAWLARAGPGEIVDWAILAAVLALCAGAALTGLTFLPAAGYVEHRARLVAFEQGALVIGTGALLRWVAGGRALPAPLLWGFAAAAAICLGSLATTTDLYSTRDEIFFRLSILALVLAAAVGLTDRAKIRVALGGLALIGAIEAAVGLGQYVGGEPTPAYWLSRAFAGMIRTRIHGTLTNPNVLAEYLLVGIGAGTLLVVDLSGRWRLGAVAALALQVAALPLTYSRGGYTGLAVFVLACGILLWPVRTRVWPVLLVVVAVAGLMALSHPAVGLRAESLTLDPADTAASRMFIWRTALRMWRAHPILGTGIGVFNAAYSAYRPLGVRATYAVLRIPGSAHNDYIQILAETGLAGAVLLVLASAAVLRALGRRYLTGDAESRLWLGAWGATAAGVATTSLVNSNLSVVSNMTALAVFTAAAAAHETLGQRPLRFPLRLAALPLAAGLVALLPMLPPLAQAPALHDRATAAVKAGRYARAVDLFRASQAADPLYGFVLPYFGDTVADLYLRRIDSSIGPWWMARDRAEALYVRAERVDPWSGYPHAALGRLRQAQGRYDEAAASLRRAIALDPYSPRYRVWLAEALLAQGDRGAAVKPLRDAVGLYSVELRATENHEGRRAARYKEIQAEVRRIRHLLLAVAP
ncbi:MAG: tetratricopeptide repeat protein [Bacillati bacterium ANGP1]|uniref:Tetratricopeptide repeat protein n=1 Tax=Candidatus Segetimicrobium genomatis TaxID=2569760 RepID=A0A537JTZ9_9BACT|nr:MAG: tetratricopeptide repeat protein [Terrabacteria group bacterium ANGP1]